MIELPEAVLLARQLSEALKGKRIETAVRGNAPHKFAFYNREPQEYAAILEGREMGPAAEEGACILVSVLPGYYLMLGGGGERICFHKDASTLPEKHQLLLRFNDGSYLTVTVQMWGSLQLYDRQQVDKMRAPSAKRVPPLSDAYTYDHFAGRFGELKEADPASAKCFLISRPGVWGLGNGYAQDILFRAGIHPRRRALQLAEPERRALYDALCATLRRAVEQRGRDTEHDLYGVVGGYQPILDRRAKGRPCPKCATAIEAMLYLGGTSYYCPTCQPL